jgi:hypothetical protein
MKVGDKENKQITGNWKKEKQPRERKSLISSGALETETPFAKHKDKVRRLFRVQMGDV